MLIDLRSIKRDGQTFNFDEVSEECLGAFSDLIGEAPFKIHVEIKPLANTYQIMGTVESHYDEMCSVCGYDIRLPLKTKVNEIIVIEDERPRNTQVSQQQQDFASPMPSVTYINDAQLDLKEFLHEMMATGFALYPQCADKKLCASRRYKYKEGSVSPEGHHDGHPGFMALKGIKVHNSQS